MAWTRARRRWSWALALVLAMLALAVPLALARRQEPTPSGTPVNVLLEDFKVRMDTAVVPAGGSCESSGAWPWTAVHSNPATTAAIHACLIA